LELLVDGLPIWMAQTLQVSCTEDRERQLLGSAALHATCRAPPVQVRKLKMFLTVEMTATMSGSIANRADRHATAVASISTMSSG
jgi:hypothetical protein